MFNVRLLRARHCASTEGAWRNKMTFLPERERIIWDRGRKGLLSNEPDSKYFSFVGQSLL